MRQSDLGTTFLYLDLRSVHNPMQWIFKKMFAITRCPSLHGILKHKPPISEEYSSNIRRLAQSYALRNMRVNYFETHPIIFIIYTTYLYNKKLEKF